MEVPGWLWAGLGLGLLVAAMLDLFWTTLWQDGGAGPLTTRLGAGLWWLGRSALGDLTGVRLSLMGPFILLATVMMWMAMFWLAWVFLLSASPVLLAPAFGEDGVASWPERFYYVGSAFFTLGNGDYQAVGDFWQISSVLCAGSGMLMITLSISYVIAVLSAVVTRRRLATQIFAIGSTPEQWVLNAWDGKSLSGSDGVLPAIAELLTEVTEQQLAYPVVHYYHADAPYKAMPMAVAMFDEGLTLIECGVEESCRPGRLTMLLARNSVQRYLSTLREGWISPEKPMPEFPNLGELRESGMATLDEVFYEAQVHQLERRRKMLRGAVEHDGWEWGDLRRVGRSVAGGGATE